MKPNRWSVYAVASLAASAAPALVVGIAYWRLDVLASAAAICLATVTLVALPVYLLLSGFVRISYVHAVTIGVALGALPVAIALWPSSSPVVFGFTSSNGIVTSVNGVATAAGWQNYWKLVGILAVLGAVAGTIFHATVVRRKTDAA